METSMNNFENNVISSNELSALRSLPKSKFKGDIFYQNKLKAITSALKAEPLDVVTLRQLAISQGGLLTDELRYRVWPKLINVDIDNISPKPSLSVIEQYRDFNQVLLDVKRSLRRFPPGIDDQQRSELQDQLISVIVRVLLKYPELCYYQGYHDICITFLLVVGEEVAVAIVDKLSMKHLREFMDTSMDRTTHILSFLYPIVAKANPDLKEFMERSCVGTIFCLSWLITWYGHVLNDYKHVVRLYDFFLACHPLMPIYLGAAIVLYREQEIMQCECEMTSIHSLLSKIPDNLPFEQLISKAGDLFLQFPPNDLKNEMDLLIKKKAEDMAGEEIPLNFHKRRTTIKKFSSKKPSLWNPSVMFVASAAVGAVAIALIQYFNRYI